MFETSKKHDPVDFACEVAAQLVDDIAVYCSGQQENAPVPTFKLEDVAVLKSGGGKMMRHEFPDALKTLAEQMDREIAELQGLPYNQETQDEIETYLKPRKNAAIGLAQTFAEIIATKPASNNKPTPPAITP